MTIKEALRILTATGAEIYCKVCTVDAVNEEARTADVSPLDESAPIPGVNLQANQCGKTGLVAFPAVGSHVVVAFLNDAAAVVVLTEQVDKVCCVVGGDKPLELTAENNALSLTLGQTTLTADAEQNIAFNGGVNGGLIIIDKLTERINQLVTAFNNHTHTLAMGAVTVIGSATTQKNTKPITVPAISSKAETLKKIEYENDKITH